MDLRPLSIVLQLLQPVFHAAARPELFSRQDRGLHRSPGPFSVGLVQADHNPISVLRLFNGLDDHIFRSDAEEGEAGVRDAGKRGCGFTHDCVFTVPPYPNPIFLFSLRLPPNQRTIQIIRLLNHPPGPEISGVRVQRVGEPVDLLIRLRIGEYAGFDQRQPHHPVVDVIAVLAVVEQRHAVSVL